MNHLRSNVCCHTSTKNILPNKLKLAWIGHTCAVLHSLSVCTAISRKLVEECIRPRFQAFAPVVHINGRHYLNVTTQNAQQKEHLKSQFLKEQSLGGKTDGREESCSCYSRLHARHAVRFRPATGSRIHRVLWVLRQLLPWLQGGQPSVALHNQVRGVLRRQLTRGARRRIRSSICSAAETGTTDAGAAAACVDDCTVNWSLYKNKHTWQWQVMTRELPVNNEAWIDCSQLWAIIIQVDHLHFSNL